jgi:hypothetical protein
MFAGLMSARRFRGLLVFVFASTLMLHAQAGNNRPARRTIASETDWAR